MTEKQLQKKCEDYLKANGLIYLHIQNNPHAQRFRAAANKRLKGFPDFVIFQDFGTTIFIELKTEEGIQSPEQKEYQKKLESLDHFYFVVRTFENFVSILE